MPETSFLTAQLMWTLKIPSVVKTFFHFSNNKKRFAEETRVITQYNGRCRNGLGRSMYNFKSWRSTSAVFLSFLRLRF